MTNAINGYSQLPVNAATQISYSNLLTDSLRPIFSAIGTFFNLVGLDNFISLTATVVIFAVFEIEAGLVALGIFAIYKIAKYCLGRPPANAVSTPLPSRQSSSAAVDNALLSSSTAASRGYVLPSRQILGTLNLDNFVNGREATPPIVGLVLREILTNPASLNGTRIDALLRDGAALLPTMLRPGRTQLTISDLRHSPPFAGSLNIPYSSVSAYINPAFFTYYSMLSNQAHHINVGQSMGFFLGRGVGLFLDSVEYAIVIQKISDTEMRLFIFNPVGEAGGPAVLHVVSTIRGAVQILERIAPENHLAGLSRYTLHPATLP